MGLELLASKIITKEEAPSVRTFTPAPSAVVFAVGLTQKGPVRTPTYTTSYEEWVRIFGSYVSGFELPQAVRQFYLNGGTELWTSRVVHYTDVNDATSQTAVKANVELNTAAGGETQGEVTSGNAEPYNLDNGQTLVIQGSNDGVGFGPTTVTFAAVAGSAVTNEAAGGAGGAEPFALADGDTLTIAVDGGLDQTIIFNTAEFVAIGAATAEEVAAVINAELVGASATVTGAGTTVTITSDTKGTGSIIDIDAASTAIVGAKLDMSSGSAGAHTGTGDFVNADIATAAEVAAAIEASGVGGNLVASDASGSVRLRSNGFGSDSNVKVNSGTANTALGFDLATHAGFAAGATATMDVDGKYHGTYANGLQIQIANATSGTATEFNLTVLSAAGVVLETFGNLTLDTDAADNYAETIINDADSGSIYITVTDLDAARATQRPANGTFTMASGSNGGALADADFTGSSAGQTGFHAFATIEGGTLLICPDRTSTAVHNAMTAYCEVTRNLEMLAILDIPAGYSESSARTHESALTESEHYALYWPRVKIPNPSTAIFGDAATLTVAPSGTLAGMYARSDSTNLPGPFAQPAGIDNGRLFGVVDLETDAVQDEAIRDKIFPVRINPIIFKRGNIYPDGSRTGKASGNFPSIGERRGASYVELTMKVNLEFAKNQNNTEELRAAIFRAARLFLLEQTGNGAFASKKPSLAFFLDVDIPGRGLNNAAVQRSGKLYVKYGLATAAPAEFIIQLVSRDTRALDEIAQARVG